MPKISIIVPVYNVEKYLPQCLDSLINQTLKDIEIIAVNDGSTDGSLSVLKDYAKKDSRIVIIDKENSGPGACRNIGIEKATGEFIQFVDSDDWIEPETCEVCYQKAIEHNVDMVSFNALFHKKENSNPYIYYNINEEKIITWKDISGVLFLNHLNIWHFIFKKSFLDKKNIHFPNLVLGEDVPFTLKAWLSSKNVYIIPKLLYHYNDSRANSICRSFCHCFDVFKFLAICEQMLGIVHSENLNQGFSFFKTDKLAYLYGRITDKKERKKFKLCANKICNSAERKYFLKRIKPKAIKSFKLKLFNIVPIFSCKKFKNSTKYKIFGIPFLKIKKSGITNKYYFFSIPILKSIKKK